MYRDNFLALSFWCTLPCPLNHSGSIQVNQIFEPTMWEPKELPLGKIDACPCQFKMFLQKEAIVFGGPLVLVMPVPGLYINLDQLENEAKS